MSSCRLTALASSTARDHFVIDFDRKALLEHVADLSDRKLSDAQIRSKYFAGCGSDKT